MINYTSQRITKVLGLIALTGLSAFMDAQSNQQPYNWAPAGPVYNAGRARNMVVDKTNPLVLYVGSASSGVFKSNNGGITWAPVNDQSTVRNISYMAQATDGSIYAATGEGFLRAGQKAKAQIGTGLYKLDESQTPAVLTPIASTAQVGTVINRIACAPNSNNMALASNIGIMVNTGSGFVAASLPGVPTGPNIMGQDLKFDSNGILYCTIGAVVGTPSLAPGSMMYKSTDASLTSFTAITPSSSVLSDNFFGRIELAIAPSNNNVIYASCVNKFNSASSASLKGLFVSYDAGSTWALVLQGSPQLDPTTLFGFISSGDYAQALLVSPTNPHQLFFGSYYFYSWTRTNNSNTNPIGDWIWLNTVGNPNTQSYLHENIHDIKFVQSSPAYFYFTTDAGVFRSVDLPPLMGNLYNNTLTNFPSYQPFYKGMVTGQFNSVSIERYPIGVNAGSTTNGNQVIPYSGFVGGTGGNGLNYFSGTYSVVTSEISHIGGEIYNAEYSKILPDAVIASRGNGDLYRSTNIKTSPPGRIKANSYVNGLSKVAPNPDDLGNATYSATGTPFKMWENYGQINSPDSAIFYNDSTRYQASVSTVSILTTATVFPFSTSRPNQYALIDSIVVRTGTVQLPMDGALKDAPAYNQPGDGKTIYVALPHNYSVSTTTTTTLSVSPVGASTLPVTFTLNTATLIDNFVVTFPLPPFMTKTVTQYPPTATGTAIVVPDPAVYYRVFATVYYKYQPGDIVNVVDNNISTKTNSYTTSLANPRNWRYGNFPQYTIAPTNTTAVSNPTLLVFSSLTLDKDTSVLATSVVVAPYATSTYTLHKYGTFTLTGRPINYTVGIAQFTSVITSTNAGATGYTLIPSTGNGATQTHTTGGASFTVIPLTFSPPPTYTILTPPASGTVLVMEIFTLPATSFSINPTGNTAATAAPNVFAVTPTISTTFTISQVTGTMTQETYSTIATSTYVLNPGNIVQDDNRVFVVNTGTTPVTYTINGTSSNTLSAANTVTTYVFPIISTTVINFGAVPMAKNNKKVSIQSRIGARLAILLNNPLNTANNDAVVVSKNPLALNDPLSFVRVSQSNIPILTDEANGVGSATAMVTVVGKPSILEWSKSGTELYYATIPTSTTPPLTYKLYRVSHINTIMDLSSSSFSGKFYNDIFKYTAPIGTGTLNPESPFRTTLVGSFDRPITSISVSNDNKFIALTFNSTGTGTTATVMYNTNDAKISTDANIGWTSKVGSTFPSTVNVTYCSMMEKTNDKLVFVGTDNGMYYTNDISQASPTWNNANDNATSLLPKVQIFDIKQQTMPASDCYNSGQIYIATNGRGVWTNGTYDAYIVDVKEYERTVEGKNLSVFPNPTNGNVSVAFNSVDGETATLQVMDISGRMVKSEELGKLNAGEVNYNFGTGDLTSGVYIVNISSNSGVKRVTKLIVTK